MVWEQIVFGTIVTRGPRSPLASNAIKEFDEACVLFTKVAKHSRRAAKALVRSAETDIQFCSLTSPLLQPILTKLSEKAHSALAACQNEKPSGQLAQQWSGKEEVDDDDELAIFAGRTRFVSTRRLSKSKQAPEGLRASGLISYPDSLPEPSVTELYRPESSTSSVDRWARTEQNQLHYPARHTEYTSASVQPLAMSQWRPPRRSHYPYTPHHHHPPSPLPPTSQPQPAPQHTAHEHSTVTMPSYSWAQQSSGVSSQFNSAPTYSAANRSQSHGYSDHPHGYEQASAPPYQQPRPQPSQQPQTQPAQPAASSELTELGLVSQESRLDERWTSFMRDSGYFEGFGYRSR
jgi:hypothetical protein